MTLINLVEQCDSKLTSAQKSFLSALGVVDNPVKGLLTLEEYLVQNNPQPGDSFVCLVPVGICFSDSKYNRSKRLHFSNIIKHLKRLGGFSFKAAGILSGYLRLNREQLRDLTFGRASSQYVVVVSKGNHRVTKRYAVSNDPRAYIPMEITIHETDDYDKMVEIEALDHTMDAAYRTSQNQEDKFKSSYYANEIEAVNLFNFLDQFSIGVADTNPNAKFGTTSHNFIKAAKKRNESICKKYLEVFTRRNCEHIIGGNATFAATIFLLKFQTAIENIDRLNTCDSFDQFMDYIYHTRKEKSGTFLENMTQAKLTEGNGKFKGPEVNVARLITLYNEFCEKVLKADLGGKNSHAIGHNSKAYNEFVKSADPDIRLRVDEVARQTYN